MKAYFNIVCLEDTIVASLKEEVPTENNAFVKDQEECALNPSNTQKKKWKKYHHHNGNNLWRTQIMIEVNNWAKKTSHYGTEIKRLFLLHII